MPKFGPPHGIAHDRPVVAKDSSLEQKSMFENRDFIKLSSSFGGIKLASDSGLSRFNRRWIVWGLNQDKNKQWDDRLQPIICIDDADSFQSVFEYFRGFQESTNRCDHYFFKEDIYPSWDDPSNVNGGRWLVIFNKHKRETMEKEQSAKQDRSKNFLDTWMRLMIALGGEHFGSEFMELICGAALIVKKAKNVIALWIRPTISDTVKIEIGSAFKKILQLSDSDRIVYEKHPYCNPSRNLSTVLMIYGLNIEQFNCSKIFNLLCMYGDCLRVKFLNPESNTCMVEMGSAEDTMSVIDHLTGLWLYGKEIQFVPSHREFTRLQNTRRTLTLPDGSPAFMDFSQYPHLFRFQSPKCVSNNNLALPSKHLYFFQTPKNATTAQIVKIFEEYAGVVPHRVIFFDSGRDKERSDHSSGSNSSGIIVFDSIDEAIEGLLMCNHVPFPNKHQYDMLKLSFAPDAEEENHNEDNIKSSS